MKTIVDWGWPIGLILCMVGGVTSIVLGIRADGTGKKPNPVGAVLAVAGLAVLVVMFCLPASYQPL